MSQDLARVESDYISMVRQELTVGDTNVLAFMDACNLYYININQGGNLIGKLGNAVNNYISSMLVAGSFDGIPQMSYKDARLAMANGSNRSGIPIFNVISDNLKYRVIPIDVLYGFIRYWDKKGNQKASDLIDAFGRESLQIRCEAAFVGVSPNVVEIQKASDHWLMSRGMNKSVHGAFTTFCANSKLPGRHIHELMTKLVFDQTKRQAIANNQLIGEDATIGLDYQASDEGQLVIARMKVKFIGLRKGTWQERVNRCFLDCI